MFKRVASGCGWLLLLLSLFLIRGGKRTTGVSGEGLAPGLEDPPDPAPLDRETYLTHRQALLDAEGEAQQNLDKSLLTLSAGAFGLSIAFVSQVEPATAVRLMYISWSAFGFSILCELASFVTSKWAHGSDVELLDEDYVNNRNTERRSRWNIVTILLNLFAGVGFVVGAVTLTIFAAHNVV